MRKSLEVADCTFIHPESYAVARQVLTQLPGGDSESGERVSDRVKAWRLLTGMNTRGAGKARPET